MKLDLQSPEFLANPYPTYARLREQAPVYLIEPGSWLVTRYQDAEFLLKSPLFDKDVPSIYNHRYGRDVSNEPIFRIITHFWVSMNSPCRKLIVKALNARKISEIRTLVQKKRRTVSGQLDRPWSGRFIDCFCLSVTGNGCLQHAQY